MNNRSALTIKPATHGGYVVMSGDETLFAGDLTGALAWISGRFELRSVRKEGESSDSLIADARVTARLRYICKRSGIITLADLANRRWQDFYCLPNTGKKTLGEARELLAAYGLRFKD